MTKILIEASTLQFHPELIEFFSEQQKVRIYEWNPNVTYLFQGKELEFKQSILTRKRGKGRGYAYEVISSQSSWSGAFGDVHPVEVTISTGKNGVYQVKDHGRVIKCEFAKLAKNEYKILKNIPHLKAKEPIEGNLVMKRMPGGTLSAFLNNNKLSLQNLLVLTKTIIFRYQQQVLKNKVLHRDLHGGNIMVEHHPEDKENPFTVNIIDYGLAKKFTPPTKVSEVDEDLKTVIQRIWGHEPYIPQTLEKAFKHSFWRTPVHFIKTIKWVVIAPTAETQLTMDRLSQYLLKLSTDEVGRELAPELYKIIFAAAAQSSSKRMSPLNQAIKQCKILLDEKQIGKNFAFVFSVNKKRQNALEKIFVLLDQLEAEGTKFISRETHPQQGEQLCTLISGFREDLYNAAHLPRDPANLLFKELEIVFQSILKATKATLKMHHNQKHIFAELGVALSSGLVLYPAVIGCHYLRTKNLGIFSQANASAYADKLGKEFRNLNEDKGNNEIRLR